MTSPSAPCPHPTGSCVRQHFCLFVRFTRGGDLFYEMEQIAKKMFGKVWGERQSFPKVNTQCDI